MQEEAFEELATKDTQALFLQLNFTYSARFSFVNPGYIWNQNFLTSQFPEPAHTGNQQQDFS
jgi:hypothetical protein